MVFNSLVFLVAFLPLAWGGYLVLTRIGRNRVSTGWLVLASLVFYGWWNPAYLPLLIGSILFNYGCGQAIGKADRKRFWLILGITGNIALLGWFKYTDFVLSLVDAPALGWVLPLAISFFTFQQIDYLVDRYRGDAAQTSLLDYALFVTFFPQLIAGPIVQHRDILGSFQKPKRTVSTRQIATGVFLFVIGLTKKVALADTFALYANKGYDSIPTLSTLEAWITSYAYTFQLYFDFSGYCDMALGLGLLFGVTLPLNFSSPYKADTIQAFWKQWHMTLNRFLTKHIYIPLGGSRYGVGRTLLHIFIVFAISGIWHGAGWTFILWGCLHGLAVIVQRLWGKQGWRLPRFLRWFLTFQFVHLAWVYFRADSVSSAHALFQRMFSFSSGSGPGGGTGMLFDSYAYTLRSVTFSLGDTGVIIGIFLLASIVVWGMPNAHQWRERFRPTPWFAVMTVALLLFTLGVLFFQSTNSTFLYFNF